MQEGHLAIIAADMTTVSTSLLWGNLPPFLMP